MDPLLHTIIKLPSTVISTFNTGLHTHQVTEYDASNITVANSSDASLIQVSHISTQGSHWSNIRTFQEDSTPLIEASTAGIMTTVLADTNTNQKTEISSWPLSLTSNQSLITTPQISTASDEALAASTDNSTAHFTHTAISKKKDKSMQLITLLPSTQVTHSLLVTSNTGSSNPVKASSVSASLVRSSSSRAASLSKSRSDISAMTSTTTTSEMVTFNSTHELATKTSIASQDSFTVDSNLNLLSHIEGSPTTVVNHTGMILATKTVAITARSSLSSSLSSTITLSYTSVVIDMSLLQTTSQSITWRSVSDSHGRLTGNIPIHTSSNIIFGSTVSLKSTLLISMIPHSLNSVLSQSTSRGSNTLVSKQEDRSGSEMHVTIATTDGSGSGSETQTARHNFTNGRSLRTTITHGSLKKTILPSFHTKASKESFSMTPIDGQSSTFPLPSGGNGSFDVSALPSFTKGRESLETYPRTVAFSMSITTSTTKVQLNTSYNLSAATKTLNLVQTLNLSTRISLPTFRGNTSTSFALSVTPVTHTINSSDVLLVIYPTASTVADFSSIGSSLPPASFIPTISYSATKRSLISKLYQATDVLSPIYVTVPSNNISLPNMLSKTTVLERTPYSSDKLLTTVFSEVHGTRVTAPVITSFHSQEITAKSILAEAKTSTKLFLSSNASGSVVTSLYQTKMNVISRSPTFNMQPSSRMINNSASEGTGKDASEKMTITQHLSATTTSQFSSTIKDAMVLMNTSNITTIGSKLNSSLDTLTPRSISNIKSTMFQTSFGQPTDSVASSLSAKSLFSVKASNTSSLLTASAAGSGSQFQSSTLVQALSSTPFIVSPGVSETSVLVLTTQKPSKGVSVNMHDKSSTHASIITVPSHSIDRNLSFAAELSSTSDTKKQRTSSILVFANSPQATIATELPFGSVSTNTLPGNSIWTSYSTTKETLDSIQTQSSPSRETPFTSRTTSSTGLVRTKTFGTAATALVATVSLSTGPPPVSPKQFDIRMVLKMTWKSHYEYSYTPEFQALASKIKARVTKVFITLDGFLSLIVVRFWKGSVGVDLAVFVKKSTEVSEDIVERTLIEANNSGVLDLPLTNIQVQERGTTSTTTLATTLSTKGDKSIERWIIILIVSGILIFFMSLIICSLLVSKSHNSLLLVFSVKPFKIDQNKNSKAYLTEDV